MLNLIVLFTHWGQHGRRGWRNAQQSRSYGYVCKGKNKATNAVRAVKTIAKARETSATPSLLSDKSPPKLLEVGICLAFLNPCNCTTLQLCWLVAGEDEKPRALQARDCHHEDDGLSHWITESMIDRLEELRESLEHLLQNMFLLWDVNWTRYVSSPFLVCAFWNMWSTLWNIFLRPRNSKESDPLRQDHPNIIKLYESFEDLRHSSFILQSKHVSSWLNYSTRECPIGDLRFYIHISRSVRWNCQCKRCLSEIWNTSWNCARLDSAKQVTWHNENNLDCDGGKKNKNSATEMRYGETIETLRVSLYRPQPVLFIL